MHYESEGVREKEGRKKTWEKEIEDNEEGRKK